MNSRDYIALDNRYGAHNYHPIPVVISKSQGMQSMGSGGKRIL